MKLSAIAAALGARLENGSPETEIFGVAGIETAGPGQITFISNPKYAVAARTTKASAVIVAEDLPELAVLSTPVTFSCSTTAGGRRRRRRVEPIDTCGPVMYGFA